MKRKALTLVMVPAISAGICAWWYSPEISDANYTPRNESIIESESPSIQFTFDYYEKLHGEFNPENWSRANSLANAMPDDRATFNWVDHGPDNIGGRTRAIVVDNQNINHLYAGSVSGGLFESFNRANTWRKVDEFESNLAISSICQTPDGTFYVATGHQAEQHDGEQEASDTGARGYGVYKSKADGSWELIEGTQGFAYINEVVSSKVNNTVWFATSGGLKKYADETLSDVAVGTTTSAVNALSISEDGTVLICRAGGTFTFVSTNSGESFVDVSDDDITPNPIDRDGSRIEYAISHEKVSGKYYIYASAANNFLRGVWRSEDNGMNWARIAPAYDGVTPGAFSPFSSGGSGQGNYDNIISVVPGSPDRIILGGIDCYSWSAGGNWEQISQWFLSQTNTSYVHADNHELVWDESGRLYIGNDGGISFSDNAHTANPEFHPANRGYGVTQFFASGFSAHGDVIGGAQDNGTKANWHDGTTWREHDDLRGGDGFSCAISFINRDIVFTSLYFSNVERSSDRGENVAAFVPAPFRSIAPPCNIGALDGSGCGQFFTNFELWENPNDIESTDSVTFIPSQAYSAGETLEIPSATTQIFINYETPVDLVFDDTLFKDDELTTEDIVITDELTGTSFNLGLLTWDFIYGGDEVSPGDTLEIFGVEESTIVVVEDVTTANHYFGTNPAKPGLVIDMGTEEMLFDVAWDTVIIQDKLQSWFALDMGATHGLWITRNALRLGDSDQGWVQVLDPSEDEINIGDIASMEFSKNGEHLFIGTWNGDLYRYSGFGGVYSPTATSETALTDEGIDTLYDWKGEAFPTRLQKIAHFGPNPLGTAITGIASGSIDDPDHLVITLGAYLGADNKVQQCYNATGDSPLFESMDFPSVGSGPSASGIPCYSAVIDRDNPEIVLVGTEFGVFATEDGSSTSPTWSNISGDFGNCPVYDMGQNWRTWEEGCKRPGEIYIGTHGRGIWSSDAFLSVAEFDKDPVNKEPFIRLYPNPASESATLSFELENSGEAYLEVFNLNGQLIYRSNQTEFTPGKHQINFDIQNLTPGAYLVKFNTETYTKTTKLIKQ